MREQNASFFLEESFTVSLGDFSLARRIVEVDGYAIRETRGGSQTKHGSPGTPKGLRFWHLLDCLD